MRDISTYPVVIVEDRYGGCYSGGAWLAVREADELYDGADARMTRSGYVLQDGPNGSDPDAMEFWANPPPWIAAGATPNAALSALRITKEPSQ